MLVVVAPATILCALKDSPWVWSSQNVEGRGRWKVDCPNSPVKTMALDSRQFLCVVLMLGERPLFWCYLDMCQLLCGKGIAFLGALLA